ncbi:uncharacterized protein HKW66_Vig0216010 [Vigna angularis]|uniref:Secreted protein n=1 Tax=Phaseolus angularis TaxID=3914 RepID=A0A8T0JFA4_PHAAN|nr:uncharacterized protein HKW66_Vig0216010 [Vigna angularis]
MRVLAIALILMVACFCCCMAGNRWNIEAQMHGKTKQLSYDNNHHGKTPARAHFDVTRGNDFVKPASVQYHIQEFLSTRRTEPISQYLYVVSPSISVYL